VDARTRFPALRGPAGAVARGPVVRLLRLETAGFRNLAPAGLEFPARGVVLTGLNGQGKTNLLEAASYPVLFRSFRGASDAELARFEASGFRVGIAFHDGRRERSAEAAFQAAGRRKRLAIDGAEVPRLVDAVGEWLAVAFQPADVALASGPALLRRQYLDRVLALSNREYLTALSRYRAALAQRNAALRQDRRAMAEAFDAPLTAAGSRLVTARLAWVAEVSELFAAELAALGERGEIALGYEGAAELADPAAWAPALARSADADRARRATTIGPHRDDLGLRLGGRVLRDYGSTGQQRSAAIVLRLVELVTLERARGAAPALLLDDVFAELDAERQRRLATRLLASEGSQVLVTAPRSDELPRGLDLQAWHVSGGEVRTA
jgi:DNA replication and repair protein RecF